MLASATPVVERVIRRRFLGASLRPSDDRYENERARDCVQQALTDLWYKLSRIAAEEDPPLRDLAGYAARVAHNAVNEVVRPPNWTRLKNRVLRVISKSPAFAVWEDPEWGRVTGYAGWRGRSMTAPPAPIADVRVGADGLRADALLGTHWDNLVPDQWRALLERVFDGAQRPLRVATLVHALAELLDIRIEVPLDEFEPRDDR
jgi:hypothetical protein